MRYQTLNNAIGWLVWLVATIVYVLTLEPTVSFWDCGEFISACYKLQVMHPPGAPLFMLIGRMFTMFASSPEKVAYMVNLSSALCSSFTILFLFWTITAFGRKLAEKAGEMTAGNMVAVLGSGIVGALAYTFSDSFWFSAVEGEVYAMSSFFTAIVFWAILKWERVADEPQADRWLVLIAYLMGLSIGVHLLNLLCIPAIAFIYYFRKHKPSKSGIIITSLASVLMLGFIQYGIIPGLPSLAATFDLIFVNTFKLPFGTGVWFIGLALIAAFVFALLYSHKHQKFVLNLAILCTTFIIIGYSTYAMIIVRAKANPAINMNAPDNVFSFQSYINREQYGDRPLFFGPYFTAEMISQEEGKMRYRKGVEKYMEIGRDQKPIFDPSHNTIFPRAYRRAGTQERHIQFYRNWLNLRKDQKPKFGQNLNFLFTYQLGHMYFRYFMWNFAGRQNDIQGHGRDIEKGNWISGISGYDETRIGNLAQLSESQKQNKGRNTYYFLPLLLGLIGLFYHFKTNKNDAWVVMILFFFTGIAINIYLNPEPLQPRERDYAYVGSFYAFAIWIGLGVLALINYLQKQKPTVVVAAAVTIVSLIAVPGIMAQQNWDDHDRSEKYTARDFAISYLESCAPNAILFTMGDNDTYPLWYAQEVEGIRKDVRIINLSLLGTDWYISQARRSLDGQPSINMTIPQALLVQGTRDYVPYVDRKLAGYKNLIDIMKFIGSDSKDSKIPVQSGETISYLPTLNFRLPVDKNVVLNNGTVQQADSNLVLPAVEWTLPRNGLYKNDLALLDIIATNNWERPIYFTVSMGSDSYLGLQNFFQLDGLTYRLVPIKSESAPNEQFGRVQNDVMFDNFVNKFVWGNMDKPEKGIYIDPETNRMTMNLKNNAIRLTESLLAAGDKERALKTLQTCINAMPIPYVQPTFMDYRIAELCYAAGSEELGNKFNEQLFDWLMSDLKYYNSLKGAHYASFDRERQTTVAVLNELIRIAKSYGQVDLASAFENKLKS